MTEYTFVRFQFAYSSAETVMTREDYETNWPLIEKLLGEEVAFAAIKTASGSLHVKSKALTSVAVSALDEATADEVIRRTLVAKRHEDTIRKTVEQAVSEGPRLGFSRS